VNTRPDAPPMVMISAHDDVELVVEAMRAGAVDCSTITWEAWAVMVRFCMGVS